MAIPLTALYFLMLLSIFYPVFTVSQNVLQSPESSFLTSLHPASTLCPSNTPSLLPSFHLPSHPSHVSGQHYEATEKIAPYVVSQKVKNGPVNLNQPRLQLQQLQVQCDTFWARNSTLGGFPFSGCETRKAIILHAMLRDIQVTRWCVFSTRWLH